MNENNETTAQLPDENDYQDLITYTPANIKVISGETSKSIKQFHKIWYGLRDDKKLLYLTVKEIHEFYKKEDTKDEYSKSLKTIYRYLEQMKKADLIVEGGRRVTKGSRMVENLYCLAAEIFFIEDQPVEERWWNKEEGVTFADHIRTLISSYNSDLDFPKEMMEKFIKEYNHIKDEIIDDIARSAETNEDVMNVYRDIPMHQINSINSTVAILTILLKHPEISDPFKKYLTKK